MTPAEIERAQNTGFEDESGHYDGGFPYEPEYDDDDDEFEDDDDFFGEGGEQFADPGGRSALRASSSTNPRNLPCPTCGRPNLLTPRDRQLGYQCDSCADALEFGGY